MLSEYYQGAERIRAICSGPSGNSIEAFAEQLYCEGYAEITARRHIRSAEHLVRWANRRGLVATDLNDLRLKQFGEHLSHCRCGRCTNPLRGIPHGDGGGDLREGGIGAFAADLGCCRG